MRAGGAVLLRRSRLGPLAPEGRAAALRLFLTSATVLFVELTLIRWIPSNIVYVGFFNNFILIASFLGIGIGIVLGRHRARTLPFAGMLLALALVVVVFEVRSVGRGGDVFLGVPEGTRLEVDLVVLAVLLGLVVAVMASLAAPLGVLLRALPPLRAYAVDVAGSLAGIGAFAMLAAIGAGPAAWFGVSLLLGVALETLAGGRRRARIATAALLGSVLFVASAASAADVWSPYYRVTRFAERDGSLGLAVNGIPHQDLLPATRLTNPPYYDQVYRWYPERRFERVLIIGSGGGTDVAVALAHNVGEVDAVEIDPAILGIGRAEHPDRPYSDARVHAYVDDGRSFLRSTDRRYDLVIFALTDSLTLVTTTANLRLESFLFTEEAFSSVSQHLAPDGVFVLYNWYREPWLIDRYGAMLERVFGVSPIVATYAQLSDVHAATLGVTRGPPPPSISPVALDLAPAPEGATDDHPFPYLRDRVIPATYLVALGALVVLALGLVAAAARAAGAGPTRFSPHFFALGAAFLLLETKSLVTFSLLFGTTWVVNALVFAGILLSVLAAVAVAGRWRRRDPRVLYAGLFASLAVTYVLPPWALLFDPAPLRYAVAVVLGFSPIFLANLVFAHGFRDTTAADMAFASNVLGAVIGGVLEWSAIVIGYQQLVILVAVLYAIAYATSSRWRVLGDRHLVAATRALGGDPLSVT